MPVYRGFVALDNVDVHGFILAKITARESEPCEAGDAFNLFWISPRGRVRTQGMKSSPTRLSRADIDIDGSFVGDTPSDLQVTVGEHTVSMKRRDSRTGSGNLR